MLCLYPDCDWPAHAAPMDEATLEYKKRQIIAHINADHADAHVLIACSHDWTELERYMATTISGQTGQPVDVGEQVRSQCVRCGQFEVRDAGAADDASESVTITKDSTGNDVLAIPAKDDGE